MPAPARHRRCGPCSFCCKVMGIAELNKPGGQRCIHQMDGGGCDIHARHPPSCQAFSCLWMTNPHLPHKIRPDQSKVVLTFDSKAQRMIAHCDPSNPLAWRRQPLYDLLRADARRSNLGVVVKAGTQVWFIGPDRREFDLGQTEDALFAVDLQADGAPVMRPLPPGTAAGQ